MLQTAGSPTENHLRCSRRRRSPISTAFRSRSSRIRAVVLPSSAWRKRLNTTSMDSVTFSFNIIADLQSMWQYDFMRHAFEAGTIVAIIAGIIGYFIVLRRSSFAAHALSHIGFAGAAGAVLFGINPLFGLLFFTVSGGFLMGILGKKAASRDIQIGTV